MEIKFQGLAAQKESLLKLISETDLLNRQATVLLCPRTTSLLDPLLEITLKPGLSSEAWLCATEALELSMEKYVAISVQLDSLATVTSVHPLSTQISATATSASKVMTPLLLGTTLVSGSCTLRAAAARKIRAAPRPLARTTPKKNSKSKNLARTNTRLNSSEGQTDVLETSELELMEPSGRSGITIRSTSIRRSRLNEAVRKLSGFNSVTDTESALQLAQLATLGLSTIWVKFLLPSRIRLLESSTGPLFLAVLVTSALAWMARSGLLAATASREASV